MLDRLRRPSAQPFRVFAVVLAIVSFLECLIMLAFGALLQGERHPIAEAVLDTTLLTTMLAPALWFLVVRPIQKLSSSRGQLLVRLFEAQEEERGRIARDLHDELGQQLTAMLVTLQAVKESSTIEQARERAELAAQSGAAGLREVRRISRGLRPLVLEDLGLGPAIERICEEFRGTGGPAIDLQIKLDPAHRFPPALETAVFRVVQESVTNAVRHADASRIGVQIEARAGELVVRIEDDGKGIEPHRLEQSFGLAGIRERIESHDGRLHVRSVPAVGTTILAHFPLAENKP
ncbi:MAG: sensor histidine kinase [Phycisphaerales bacterium]|nr:sensor histidine kinase [Phycisphaerales bacterium]